MAIDQDNVVLRGLVPGDMGWLIQKHAELYLAEEGFDWTFEVLVAKILIDYIQNRDVKTENAWIAVSGNLRLGSIFCVSSNESGVAKLRLFLLIPQARGLGLGQRLLEKCIDFAESTGNHAVRLWTHESHRAACALYAKNGFQCISSMPVRSFGQDLVEQTWELRLV